MTVSPIVSLLVSLAAGAFVILVRLKTSNRPVTLMKIVMPPLGMSTGFLMFIEPSVHFPWMWGVWAFFFGAGLLSMPLIRTTKLEKRGELVYLQRSKAFVLVLVGLLVMRLTLHDWVEHHISITQTAGVFFVLAFGMILCWRAAMLVSYLKVKRAIDSGGD